jgi:predicted PurR-regulated permease PerM
MDKPFRISIVNVLQILALGIGLWFLFIIKDVIVIFFIAWMASTILQPVVDKLEERHIPRSITSAILVLSVVGFLILFVIASIPLFTSQFEALVKNGPSLIDNFIDTFNLRSALNGNKDDIDKQVSEVISSQLKDATGSAITLARAVADSVLSIFVTSFLSFYFLTDKNVVKKLFLYFFPNKELVEEIYGRVEHRLRVWMRGQGLVMILIGVITYIGLKLLGIEYALPLAVFAGFLEIIPFIGPTISAVPAILIALSDSPIKALSVLLMYVVIQQLEASLVVPRVMNKAVGLNPIIIILAVMIGSRAPIPAGALLAIPIAAILTIGYEEWQLHRTKEAKTGTKTKPKSI